MFPSNCRRQLEFLETRKHCVYGAIDAKSLYHDMTHVECVDLFITRGTKSSCSHSRETSQEWKKKFSYKNKFSWRLCIHLRFVWINLMYSTPPPNCISVNDGSDLTCIQWIMLLTVVASYWSRRGPSSMVWVRSSLELRLEGRTRTYPTAKVCWLLPFLSSFQREFSSCRPQS